MSSVVFLPPGDRWLNPKCVSVENQIIDQQTECSTVAFVFLAPAFTYTCVWGCSSNTVTMHKPRTEFIILMKHLRLITCKNNYGS